MKYRIEGHDRLTAVLDMLIALLPDEKHIPDDGEGGDICISSLDISEGEVIASAPEKALGLPIHSPVDGVVLKVSENMILIESSERK